MSGNDAEPQSSRRTAGILLGGLAVGAVLGAGIVPTPGQASAGDPVEAGAVEAERPEGSSFQEQFRQAFTPGPLHDGPMDPPPIFIQG